MQLSIYRIAGEKVVCCEVLHWPVNVAGAEIVVDMCVVDNP